MIKNAKGIGRKTNTDADIFFSHTYSIEDEEIRCVYEEFLKQLAESISFENKQQTFSYNPQDIEELYNNVCRNTYDYIVGHRFLSKYNIDSFVEMLLKSTSEQLQDFRGILFAIYRHAGKGEFDEKDIEALEQLLENVKEKYDGENSWDKIQLMQIKWLMLNLEQFIKQMS